MRRSADPHHHLLWIVDTPRPYASLFSVFDGAFLFSAAYWNPAGTDQTFRSSISSYNAANHTHIIWAAGVQPGYNDTRLRGSAGYVVPRNNGTTYRTSWNAAINSSPDWVTISTWNEWYEGGMIEPSRTYHNLYLNLTRHYSHVWRFPA